MTHITDEQAETAKTKLDAAIREYQHTIDPNIYIDAWALVIHKLSVELEAENKSEVSHLTPTRQAWPMTVGILRIASNSEEEPGSVWAED